MRNRLDGASNWLGWMEGWMYDRIVLEAASIQKKK